VKGGGKLLKGILVDFLPLSSRVPPANLDFFVLFVSFRDG
jgi:hypothetical protein